MIVALIFILSEQKVFNDGLFDSIYNPAWLLRMAFLYKVKLFKSLFHGKKHIIIQYAMTINEQAV